MQRESPQNLSEPSATDDVVAPTSSRKLAFALVLVVGALALIELAARLFAGAPTSERWSENHRLVAVLGFPALNEIFVEDDRLFWRLKPNLSDHVLEGRFADGDVMRFTVSTDHRGLRHMPEVPATQHRIAFVGDSCTFGLGVDDDETFPALIQQANPQWQCVNLAVPGYTAFQGRRVLEAFSFDGPVDVVVITFGRNDDLEWDGMSDMEHAAAIEARRSSPLRFSRAAEVVGGWLSGLAPAASGGDRPTRPRLTDEEFVEQIRAMIRRARSIGAKPVLVVWPLRAQLDEQPGLSAKQVALMRAARIEDVPLVNLVPAFRAHADTPNLIIDVVHAGPPGCALAAEQITPVIREALTDAPDP